MASRIDCAALVGDRYGAASLVQWAQFHLGPGCGVAQVDLRKRGNVEGLVRDEGVPGRPDAQGSGDIVPHRGLPGSELDQLAWMGMGRKSLDSRCDLRQVADSFDSPAEALFWCARFGVASAFEPHRAPRSRSVAVDQFLYLGREL
ncbi:hypothetical protein [Streptomyces sp. NBC_01800]|uniref:hypothetical protein n=1 Tax=Streptomyces sp. NBC_01800 TaxID=2975945 RepID=UPI002DDA62DF|nr:hypothetical protein [Streptomyces sp. NBC_01800]WSA74135.1 hypothetical protein OIE65_03260 [Streptomyces sp. NBC_01800]